MNLSGISIRRPVAVSMVVMGILLLGFVSLQKIPLNLLPDITYPKITIRTEYPHAAPREIEERVTKPIESYVGIINNVVKVSSVSRPGWSDVYVEFIWGSDVDVIAMDIREKLQLLNNLLPEEVEKPILLRYDPNQDPIMTLAVSGEMEDLSELRRWVEMNVELELERLDGIAAVKIEGGYQDEVRVEIDEEKLSRYGLSISTVSDRLSRANLNVASGSLEHGGAKLAVRTINRFQSLEDIRNVVVAEKGEKEAVSGGPSLPSISMGGMGMSGMGMGGGFPAGLSGLLGDMETPAAAAPAAEEDYKSLIRVKDVARVRKRHKERTEIARLNGNECIKVSVYKEGDANIVTVADEVEKALQGIRLGHRAEPRSIEWQKKLKDPRRHLKKFANGVSHVLLNYRPFKIEKEPVQLKHGINLEVISDQSVFIVQSVFSVAQTAIWGALLAVFIIYVFLRNISSTFIVGIAIPVSIIATFNLMYFGDISFNVMSLGGLALGVGLMVDNSIVVLENILRRRTFEPDLGQSAHSGTSEVASAITASTLTNIMVFFPILYLEGMFRQIFGDLAYTVAFSLVCSEAVALSVVPMLSVVMGNRVRLPPEMLRESGATGGSPTRGEENNAGQTGPAPEDKKTTAGSSVRFRNFRELRENALRKKGEKPGCLHLVMTIVSYLFFIIMIVPVAFVAKKLGRGASTGAGAIARYPLALFDAGFNRLKAWYPGALRKLLAHPFIVILVAVSLAGSAAYGLYRLGWELLPSVDQGEFRIRVELPTGTPIQETNRRIADLEDKIKTISHADKITSLFATVGTGSAEGEGAEEKAENIGEIHVNLVDRDMRDVVDEVIITQAMHGVERSVEVDARSSKPRILSYKTPVEIELEGNDLAGLSSAAETVMGRIRRIPGLLEIESSMAEKNPEVNITIDRDRAAALGLSVSEITEVVRRKVKGEASTTFELPEEQIDIVVALQERDRNSPERLRRITIPSASGNIRLGQVASIRRAQGPANITRSENSRVALIRANIHGRPLGDVVADIKRALSEEETVRSLPPDIRWDITGQNEEMERSKSSLYLALTLAIALVYIVLAAQFESLLHPFVIMFCVPFSLVGLAVILFLTGQTINIFSLIGMLMMIGIAVNDAIVLVTTINNRRDEGMERSDAIVEAGKSRLRPIAITTLTTALGMVPLALALGPGAELRTPMALSVIGGLTSSTIFTIFAIPCLYLVLDKIIPRSYQHRRKMVKEYETAEEESREEHLTPGSSGDSSS
ncbi:MAG: efflux RND transporter permease subunit [bacterium]